MIKDWNRGEVKQGEVFHFQHSLRPFIWVYYQNQDDTLFIDINEDKAYTFCDLEFDELSFYEDEEDEDFYGLDVVGKIEWVEVS